MKEGLRGLKEGREMEVNFSGGAEKGLVAVAVKERSLRVKRGGEKRRVVADMAPAGQGVWELSKCGLGKSGREKYAN